ncbi:MAG TPA: MBL fold metallo-hydrolase, partial [Euzebyales bacterium]|nr:MBL fold metallo-hydrolase [Euzebyales bacterium]
AAAAQLRHDAVHRAERAQPMTSYSGHVEPGGPPARRTVEHAGTRVAITKLSVGPMDNNCYVLTDVANGGALVIDAANDAERVLTAIGNAQVSAVVTTHRHADHWQALAEVARATGAAVVHHEDDAAGIPVPAARTVDHGDTLTFGTVTVEVRHTPGHTDGSICLVLRATDGGGPTLTTHLFTGDTLFPGGPGKTQDATQFDRVMRSLREQLFVLPDDTWVYPGHGDDTTLGAERDQLDHWQARGW